MVIHYKGNTYIVRNKEATLYVARSRSSLVINTELNPLGVLIGMRLINPNQIEIIKPLQMVKINGLDLEYVGDIKDTKTYSTTYPVNRNSQYSNQTPNNRKSNNEKMDKIMDRVTILIGKFEFTLQDLDALFLCKYNKGIMSASIEELDEFTKSLTHLCAYNLKKKRKIIGKHDLHIPYLWLVTDIKELEQIISGLVS